MQALTLTIFQLRVMAATGSLVVGGVVGRDAGSLVRLGVLRAFAALVRRGRGVEGAGLLIDGVYCIGERSRCLSDGEVKRHLTHKVGSGIIIGERR
jgi:hypothetical protein